MKIHPVGAKLLHADRQTDKYDEDNTFHNFANTCKNLASHECSQYLFISPFWTKCHIFRRNLMPFITLHEKGSNKMYTLRNVNRYNLTGDSKTQFQAVPPKHCCNQ
jgi:hypothetical protein